MAAGWVAVGLFVIEIDESEFDELVPETADML